MLGKKEYWNNTLKKICWEKIHLQNMQKKTQQINVYLQDMLRKNTLTKYAHKKHNK